MLLSSFWEIPFAYTHERELDFDKQSTDIIWLHKNGAEGRKPCILYAWVCSVGVWFYWSFVSIEPIPFFFFNFEA